MVQRKKCSILLLALLFIGFNSCNQDQEYLKYQTVAKEGMHSKPYVFELKDLSTDSIPQNLFVRLRNDNSYAFSNIFLICTLKSGDQIVLQDTLEYAMATPDGSWLGSGFTEAKESKLWWKEAVVLPSDPQLTVEISQAMRNNGEALGVSLLKGIVSIGVSIEAQH